MEILRGYRLHPSIDHIGLGAAGAWILERLAGIAPAADGYRAIRFEPLFDRQIGGMRARYLSACGPVESEWHFERDHIRCRVSVPAGAEGRLALPVQRDDIRVVRGEEGVEACHSADGRLSMDLRSGQYEFIIAINNEEA